MNAIEYISLNKTFGAAGKVEKALNNVSFSVTQGDIYGFLGPNGAGKSTAIKILMGFMQCDSGETRVFDSSLQEKDYRKHLGYLSELPFFYEHLTAYETLIMSGQLSNQKKDDIQARTDLLLQQVNLLNSKHKRISTFSKGMKQRLGVANALIHDPPVLIFDEPMSGLDPVGRHQIKKLIIELRKVGKTIFFSSHILSDIETLCSSIGIINKGNLLYNGSLDNFLNRKGESLEDKFIELVNEDNNARSL